MANRVFRRRDDQIDSSFPSHFPRRAAAKNIRGESRISLEFPPITSVRGRPSTERYSASTRRRGVFARFPVRERGHSSRRLNDGRPPASHREGPRVHRASSSDLSRGATPPRASVARGRGGRFPGARVEPVFRLARRRRRREGSRSPRRLKPDASQGAQAVHDNQEPGVVDGEGAQHVPRGYQHVRRAFAPPQPPPTRERKPWKFSSSNSSSPPSTRGR